MKFYDIDSEGQIRIQRLTTIERNDAAPSVGRLAFDINQNVLYIGDGSQWKEYYTVTNDGDGSGLDSDMVDSHHADNEDVEDGDQQNLTTKEQIQIHVEREAIKWAIVLG